MFRNYIGIGILTVIITVTIVYAFSLSGSPLDARNEKFDKERVSDLQQIRSAITSYASKNNKLPESINDLKEFFYTVGVNEDPETKQSYVYEKGDNAHFKLCATFTTDASDKPEAQIYTQDLTVIHKKGYQCFDYEDQILKSQYYPSPAPYYVPSPYASTTPQVIYSR